MACRASRPQRELLRLTEAGPGRLPGRGCYLCRTRECAAKAVKGGQIARALKAQGTEPPLARLLEWMELPSA